MTRMLFLLRGVAGSGKSTFVRENGLEPYTVSSDKMRLLMSSPAQDEAGKPNISMRKDRVVWEMIGQILESRYADGATTILDATNLRAKDIREERNRAQRYRYRVYIVDFTDVPEHIVRERNAARPELLRVPDHVITRQLNIARSSEVPGSLPVLTREEALDIIRTPYAVDVDPDQVEHVNVIGDVHGCASALAELMEEIGDPDPDHVFKLTAPVRTHLGYEDVEISIPFPLPSDKYVFVGDYLDRGIENAHVLEYIRRISSDPEFNVTLLEGNHEKWLRKWGEGADPSGFPDIVKDETIPQLEAAGISRKKARAVASKLGQYSYLRLPCGNDVFVNHGGLSRMPEMFAQVSASELIHGSGDYDAVREVDAYWERQAAAPDGHGVLQAHGHRNTATAGEPLPVLVSDHVACLEGGVERGGDLRAIRIDVKTGDVEAFEIPNSVFHVPASASLEDKSVKEVVEQLRANRNVKEKKLKDGISSFNFTREALTKRRWDEQSVKARGLFIDTESMRIKARSYDKFFSVGERDETRLEALAKTMSFPVTAYAKENGYLGICSHDGDGKLFCASKSTDDGIFAERFDAILHDELGDKAAAFSKFLEERDLSAVFEIIDPANDHHIVRYKRPAVVLLALIANKMSFEELEYDELKDAAARFGLDVKSLGYVIETPDDLVRWYSGVKKYGFMYRGYDSDGFGNAEGDPDRGYHVEGFVLTDSNGRMVKVKGDWYQFWKFFRGVARDIARKGSSAKVSRCEYVREMPGTPDVDDVYMLLKQELAVRDGGHAEDGDPNIIELRDEILERLGQSTSNFL